MDRHLIDIDSTLLQALDRLNNLSGGVMTLFVTDCSRRVMGTLTDGDIRRALLSGATVESPVQSAMRREFSRITGAEITAASVESIRLCRARGIRLIPRVDDEGVLTGILDLSVQQSILPLRAILMAGGKGERLRPLTLSTPKPLLEIGGKAIIDYNIEALAANGIDHITVTINYLADKMREHFSRPVAGVSVRCVQEDRPLGTIGAVSLCDLPEQGDTLVMNSDLLTTISYEDMYLHHISRHADITIATVPYQVSVPFAILTGDDDRVTSLEEKPSYTYMANAGIYIISNRLLRQLPSDTRTDATDLIEQAIARGLVVTRFPINGTWIDVGSPADFRQAVELVKFSKHLAFSI